MDDAKGLCDVEESYLYKDTTVIINDLCMIVQNKE